MGMFSEIAAQCEAERLEGVLLKAYRKGKKSEVYRFCKKNLLPIYTCCAIGPASDTEIDEITGKLPLY